MEKIYYIKNMVCDRCILVVKDAMEDESLKVESIKLGEVVIDSEDHDDVTNTLERIFVNSAFSLLTSSDLQLVENVKTTLIRLFDDLPLNLNENISSLLARELNQDYSKMSKIFSTREKITIEKYFIKLRIEKVKELIQNDELNFTEISQLLDYSNVNHLSTQFKNSTGKNLTLYKVNNKNFRNSLDRIL
ncbi:helix-turn-helix domain-containing protein [Ulvibacter antarcticus]|uniref:AraC-like DNA-binding protein n=1 Tax=Ulvibacter antarcticus TaxID=442714 RepID=A0A3L9Z0M0_9FLAO|nr:AraC family transcriptional regulator [Ulvibacter antarcticus]RMA66511.1 AraC-like DNA-binding protein [Ulvibacter antarcticus]